MHYIECVAVLHLEQYKMAQNRLSICLPSAESRLRFLSGKYLMPPSLVIPFRNKGKSVGQNSSKHKIKKDQRVQNMKDFVKRMEIQKLTQSAALKAAKKGDPLDPEMLNPTRKRPPPTITYEEKDKRFLLSKEWSRYQMKKELERRQLLGGMVKSREKALRELKKVAPHLHSKSLELNPVLFPFEWKGPTETPPIPAYLPPDPDE